MRYVRGYIVYGGADHSTFYWALHPENRPYYIEGCAICGDFDKGGTCGGLALTWSTPHAVDGLEFA